MMYNDVKTGDIPILSFLKGTNYAMYVGPKLTPRESDLLKSKDIPVPVIYLPEVLEQLSEPVLKYNFPGVTMQESLTAESIYAQIRDAFNGRFTPENKLIVRYVRDGFVVYDAKDSLTLAISYLINKCSQVRPCAKRKVKMACFKKSKDNMVDLFNALFDTLNNEQQGVECSVQAERITSDERFDDEMKKAFREAEAIINGLILKGCPREMLQVLINRSVTLSHLRITRQFRIFLTDYENKEIKMGPLPKTVFLFFLRHPEGVMFSHLQDYRDELLKIYSYICTNDDPQKMEDSIKRLIDPFDNSISEKCAAVKKAFILNIADHIASNYYISGVQGEKKGIPLDRSLVEWECEL